MDMEGELQDPAMMVTVDPISFSEATSHFFSPCAIEITSAKRPILGLTCLFGRVAPGFFLGGGDRIRLTVFAKIENHDKLRFLYL